MELQLYILPTLSIFLTPQTEQSWNLKNIVCCGAVHVKHISTYIYFDEAETIISFMDP